jgi:hypothetical protein
VAACRAFIFSEIAIRLPPTSSVSFFAIIIFLSYY